jgi:hypothetical protein
MARAQFLALPLTATARLHLMTATLHPFERAGLGVAPFRYIGFEYRVGPIRTEDPATGVTMEVGSPGQPMGTCALCGQGIAECCLIQDANGKRFIVGNVCVMKTGDATIADPVKRAVTKHRREARHVREAARIVDTERRLHTDTDLRAWLAAQPAPFRASETRLDWALWMLTNAGTTGKMRVARLTTTFDEQTEAREPVAV